jgi:hypothetical protein
LQRVDHRWPVDDFHEHTDDARLIEAGAERHRNRHADAVGELLLLGHPDPCFAAAGGLEPWPVANLTPTQRRNRGGDHLTGGVGDPELLQLEIALRVLQELQNPPVGIGGQRVVLDEPQLRPSAQAHLAIEEQQLETFFGLDSQAFEVEPDALVEGTAGDAIGGHAGQGHRYQ